MLFVIQKLSKDFIRFGPKFNISKAIRPGSLCAIPLLLPFTIAIALLCTDKQIFTCHPAIFTKPSIYTSNLLNIFMKIVHFTPVFPIVDRLTVMGVHWSKNILAICMPRQLIFIYKFKTIGYTYSGRTALFIF